MKIHAWLAKHAGLSRRKAEDAVRAGAVTVNGQKAHVGQVITGREAIVLEGQRVTGATQTQRLLLLNKAPGTVCSSQDERGKPSVLNNLPVLKGGKWMIVGRLDIATEGLLLVTNDGDLAQHFAHPSNGYERTYLVRINGQLSTKAISELKRGIKMEEGMARFSHIEPLKRQSEGLNAWYKVGLRQGRYRMVRRMMEQVGFKVSRLKRIQFGPFVLGRGLKSGAYEEVDAKWLTTFLTRKHP